MATPVKTVTIQANLTVTDAGSNESQGGLMLYKDDNNYAWICTRGTDGDQYRIQVVTGGDLQYNNQTTGITYGKDVKIEYNFAKTTIKFYQYTAGWQQMGDTQIDDLGTPLYAVLTSDDYTTYANADTVILDDFFMVNGVYSTNYPTSGIIMEDDFTDNLIDTAKWDETDPNGRVAETDGKIVITNSHSSDIVKLTDKLQSDNSVKFDTSGFLLIL